MDKDKENIQVMVRVRPLNEHELSEGSRSCILLNEENPNLITIDTKPEPKTFFFDYSGGEKLTQKEVFQIVGSPSALAAVEGYNVCIFAYGQTGTGKTYTMLGNIKENEHKGLQIRVFEHIFHLANQFRKENTCEFVFKCIFFEIYNEEISDLLSDNFNNLQVREDLKKGPYIEGITEEIVNNPDELIQLLLKGTKNRHVGSTLMNSESSR